MRRDAAVLRTSITATAAILAALAALTACGPVQMGAAAITGDHGIAASTLASEVSNLETAYKASHGIQLQFPASQVPQQVLAWLVRFRVRERVAVRNGVAVSRAESQRALVSISAQARQNHVTLADLAVANGLPPDLLPELGRYQAIEEAVIRKLDGGTLPTSPSTLSALSLKFNREQCLAAKSLRIRINPQFGRMDYSSLSVVPAPLTLSAPEGGLPSPSQSVRPAPPC